jgi:hypothetical protein
MPGLSKFRHVSFLFTQHLPSSLAATAAAAAAGEVVKEGKTGCPFTFARIGLVIKT